MFKSKLSKWVPSLILTLALTASSATQAGGRDVGNGDMLAAQFAVIAKRIAKTSLATQYPGFEAAAENTSVVSQPRIIVDGVEKDAINDRLTNTITVSRARFLNTKNPVTLARLVIHEYFGILKYEDSDHYQTSDEAIAFLKAQRVDFTELTKDSNLVGEPVGNLNSGKASIACDADFKNRYDEQVRLIVATSVEHYGSFEGQYHTTAKVSDYQDAYITFGYSRDEFVTSTYDLASGKMRYTGRLMGREANILVTSDDLIHWTGRIYFNFDISPNFHFRGKIKANTAKDLTCTTQM